MYIFIKNQERNCHPRHLNHRIQLKAKTYLIQITQSTVFQSKASLQTEIDRESAFSVPLLLIFQNQLNSLFYYYITQNQLKTKTAKNSDYIVEHFGSYPVHRVGMGQASINCMIQVEMLQYKSMKALEINANLAEIESRLNKYPYLSKNNLPGSPDGRVFTILETNKRFPDRKVNPNFYHWYILMKQFSLSTINKWVSDELYHDHEDSLINEFVKLYTSKKDILGESTELTTSESRNNKLENSSEIEYAIDIVLIDYNPDKISSLRKLLDQYRAQITLDELNNPKYIRIVCKIDPANLDEFSGKISKCIEFNQLSLKKKDMKGQKSIVLTNPSEKVE